MGARKLGMGPGNVGIMGGEVRVCPATGRRDGRESRGRGGRPARGKGVTGGGGKGGVAEVGSKDDGVLDDLGVRGGVIVGGGLIWTEEGGYVKATRAHGG